MQRIYAAEINQHMGQRVLLAGWVHNVRLLGKVNFLVLRDASGTCQVLMNRMQLSGAQNLRETTLFSRDLNRLTP